MASGQRPVTTAGRLPMEAHIFTSRHLRLTCGYTGVMEPALKRTFVRFSIDRLKLLASRIEDCLGRLTKQQVWARSNENQNAIGNLVLHLCGNVRQWIISGIGGAPDVRQRDAEFAARATASRPELAAALTTTLGEALTVLENLPLTRLGERLIVQDREVTVLEGIYTVVEHFAGHTGQIIFATKLHAGQDLGQKAVGRKQKAESSRQKAESRRQ